jgi:hypothetical protein
LCFPFINYFVQSDRKGDGDREERRWREMEKEIDEGRWRYRYKEMYNRMKASIKRLNK